MARRGTPLRKNRAKIDRVPPSPRAIFADRREAGRLLVPRLLAFRACPGALVLALPRGGVPVAYEVALALRLPLDLFLVRKLGVPGQPELAMGAIASGGVQVLNPEVVNAVRISPFEIAAAAAREALELERRERNYRGPRPPLPLAGRAVILIDDGLATGSTMRAAILALRRREVAKIVVAVPVAPARTRAELETQVAELVCLETPAYFESVGEWYRDFSQTTEAEVRHLLQLRNPSHGTDVTQVLQ
jgi:putative phosphoribosyl transferase